MYFGYRDFIEETEVDVKKNRQLSSPPDTVRTPEQEMKRAEHMAKHGYGTVEHALYVLRTMKETAPRARAKQDEFDRNYTRAEGQSKGVPRPLHVVLTA